ncbi:MAG: iron-containing alcohol dehydrogenase [Treponema sp.]|nr:iron-containing alcohol dehydrogenase [Treponema sp.]
MKYINENNIPTLQECLKHADETKELIIKKNALEEIPGLLDKFFPPNATVCLITDENIFRAAGNKVQKILEKAGKKIAGSHIFPGEPRLHADYKYVGMLKKWISSLPGSDNIVPISVGAGTVNDLVKCTSSELKIPYLSVPVAASVDGFTPNGAALLLDGYKQTLPCPAPKVLAADIDIIAAAPAYLASSGFGDLASKIITGTDWIIAAKAGTAGAPEAPAIDEVCWTMTQNGLLPALKKSVSAAKGDPQAIIALFQSLAITGFAMQYYKDSRPVSGSEHLYSHVWEMEDLCVDGVPVTHGHKVTIGTLAATAFTELFFADPSGPPPVPKGFQRPGKAARKAETEAAFKGSSACSGITETALNKLMDDRAAEKINQCFRDSWKEVRAGVMERLLPYREMKDLLGRAGCPLTPETVGLTRTRTIATARKAQMMRNKYCILDLAWDMGVFEDILAKMESSPVYLF